MASSGETPFVVEPPFAAAPRADAAVRATGRTAIRTFRPFVRRDGAANDARAFASGCKLPRAFSAELVERPDARVTSRADADRAITPCRDRFCAGRHPGPEVMKDGRYSFNSNIGRNY